MKIICSILAVLFLRISANSQNHSFDLGFEAGPSLAWLSGNKYLAQTASPGLSGEVGLTLQYNINKVLSVRMCPGYARKGSKFGIVITDETGIPTREVNLFTNVDYFTLPLLLRANYGNKIKGFVNAGPYIAGLINFSEGPTKSSGITMPMRHYKSFDYGITWGLGLQLPINERCTFTVEGRHNLGLFDICTPNTFSDGEIKTNTLVLLLGWAWRIAD